MQVCHRMQNVFCALVSLFIFQLSADPVIKIENYTHDCGLFTEGKGGIATAVFNFQNTGDTVLKIQSVRPGCGCVVAAYDTCILPGKSGRIQLNMNLSGYSGQISKSATILSNAKNEPTIRISFHAKIQPLITISDSYIILGASNKQQPFTLFLTSLKKDLKITDVTFKLPDNNSSSWQHQLSIPVTYEWNIIDSITSEGFNVFKLTMKTPELKESISSNFILSTNHPDKREIQISGKIEKQ
ncbi:MAG TPA: DUF1573 domain-containing protein [Chitinispirillaceae bacterium]|nr:DUF1573 domain-containing protein [Chitinispirillaceae bacterium]